MTFKTPAGKEIQIKRSPVTAQYKVEFVTGGELPEEFNGSFSTEEKAKMTILMYLDRIDKKKTKPEKE